MTLAGMVTLAPIPCPTFRWSPWCLLPGPNQHVHCTALGMWGQPHHWIAFQHHTHSACRVSLLARCLSCSLGMT